MPNTNSQTIHQMGLAINAVVRQATGRDVVQNIDMDWVTVAQNKTVQVFSNSIPYMFQRTGGGMNIGNARLSSNKVIGGTLAWNQLIENGNFATNSKWSAFSTSYSTISILNNKLTQTFESIVSGSAFQFGVQTTNVPFINKSHKHLFSVDIKSSFDTTFVIELGGSRKYTSSVLSAGTKNTLTFISDVENYNNSILMYPSSGVYQVDVGGQTVEYSNAVCYDLTQMFGSTIADYIYSLETANAGDGVAWFHKYFPDSYYDYNAGELLSVSGLVSHDMTGFNQWDEVWENGYITDASDANAYSNVLIRSKNYIRILPDTSYYFHNGGAVSNADVYFYNANKEYLGRDNGGHQALTGANQNFTTPADAYYMRFYMGSAYGTTYRNNICINFSNPDLNGKYEPYKLYSYPLDSDLVLRGIPKLDTNNNLYYDGDVYEHDGKVTRKYGVVDLGSLTWTYRTSGTDVAPYFYVAFNGIKSYGNPANNAINAICAKYKIVARNTTAFDDKAICGDGSASVISQIQVKDSAYTDAIAFKEAMSGVYLVYELAEPTTETADPFTDPQVVSPYGTEEYISTGIVPVGNETQYLELSDTNM